MTPCAKPAANVVDADEGPSEKEEEEQVENEGETPDARAALASAFQALHYNPQAQSLIADVIDALHGDE